MKKQRPYSKILGVTGTIILLITYPFGIGAQDEEPASNIPTATERSAASFLLLYPSEQHDICIYIVQDGDTLAGIAARFTGNSANVSHILSEDGTAFNKITPGDRVHIPISLLLPQYQCTAGSSECTRSSFPLSPLVTPEPAGAVSKPMLTPPPQDERNKILAEIEGIVFADHNNNGKRDADEPGMPGIRVVLTRGSREQITDKDGKVSFVNLDPGEHTAGIHIPDLSPDYCLSTRSPLLISLSEGSKGVVLFGLRADECSSSSSEE